MRTLRYSDAALDDLDRIAEFITREGDGLATAIGFLARLQQRCERLANLPGTLGTDRPDLRPGLRSLPRGSYVIFFRYVGDDVLEIVNILNGRSDVLAYFRQGD